MRILQLCPRSPWPPRDGGRVAMLQAARGLARAGARLDVLTMNPKAHAVDAKAAATALSPIPYRAVTVDPSKRIAPMVRAVVAREPYVAARFYSRDFESALDAQLRAADYDIVHVESPFLACYVPAIRRASRARIVLRAQNVEFRIWETLARHASGLRAAAIWYVARSLRSWEIALLENFDAIVPITAEDAAEFRGFGCSRPIHVMPSGIEPAAPSANAEAVDPRSVYFIGFMGYRPNLEAGEWIVDTLWPRLQGIAPEVRLTMAGTGFPAALAARARAVGITVARDVPDVAHFAAPFGVMIAPVFSGGGMRIKVLEAAAMGKAIVTIGLGAGGLDLVPGRDYIEAGDVDSFAQAVARCVREPEAARRMGAAARAHVRERYDADVLAKQLLEFYAAL